MAAVPPPFFRLACCSLHRCYRMFTDVASLCFGTTRCPFCLSSAPLLLTLSTPGAPLAPCTAYMRHPEAKLLDQHACPMRCAALGAQTSPFRHRCYYYTNESNGAW